MIELLLFVAGFIFIAFFIGTGMFEITDTWASFFVGGAVEIACLALMMKTQNGKDTQTKQEYKKQDITDDDLLYMHYTGFMGDNDKND